MTNKELQHLLAQYPDDMPVRLLPSQCLDEIVIPLTEEHILHTSDKAWVDDDAPVEEWDCEDGKIHYDGQPFLLFNPIIL